MQMNEKLNRHDEKQDMALQKLDQLIAQNAVAQAGDGGGGDKPSSKYARIPPEVLI